MLNRTLTALAAITLLTLASFPAFAELPELEDPLAAPKLLGLEVISHRTGYDEEGHEGSWTRVAASGAEVFARLRHHFIGPKPFARGWTIIGAGQSKDKRSCTAMMAGPNELRFRLKVKEIEAGVSEIQVLGRPRLLPFKHLAEPAPDRTIE